MSAVLKTRPPTLEEARATLADHERALLDFQRANSTARSAIVLHLAQGNEIAAEECRREISQSAQRIASTTDAIDQAKQVVEAIVTRNRLAGNARIAEEIVNSAKALYEIDREKHQAVAHSSELVLRARVLLDNHEALLARSGMARNPDIVGLSANTVQIAYYTQTGGILGKYIISVASDDERKRFANIERVARNYFNFTMKKVQEMFGASVELLKDKN